MSRRQGAIAQDLAAAADFAEITLAMQLGKHQNDALEAVHAFLAHEGPLWWNRR